MDDNTIDRREALRWMAWLSASSVAGSLTLRGAERGDASPTRHPHIFINAEERTGLRSIASVRKSIQSGIPRKIWELIQAECDAERGVAAMTARSVFEGRYLAAAEQNNPDYTICHAAGQRILRNALAMLITEKEVYRETALKQIWALIDETVWPDWIDQAHTRFGHPVDLRTGMLSQDVAIGFDWLYPYLSDDERERILEGLDRRGIQPFFTSMEQDPWWSHDLNNWYTVIIGGLGIAGMALGDAHPRSQELIDLSLGKMRDYLSIYGAGGEFNESVAYSNATRIPVNYFYAYYYHLSGGKNILSDHPFPQTAEWTIYATLPPGRYAAFGDGHVGATPMVGFMTAIATATHNPVIQGFCERHLETDSNPFLLLWFDPSIESSSPEGRLPRGRAFRDNGAHLYSRTDWNPESTAMVVYGKAKRDHNHDHNDVGQVCIDAMGQRMIVDPGSPSAYPADFFEKNRWKYYNASTVGHNVPMFGNREQRSQAHTRGVKGGIDFDSINGRILQADFDDDKGGFWQLDLSRAYDGVASVTRTVVHLFPGFVAVLDEGELVEAEEISLRWHTIEPAPPSDRGDFLVSSQGVGLAGRVEVVKGNLIGHKMRRQIYEAPFDRERSGGLLEQRREPYVETSLLDKSYRVLTLFVLIPDGSSTEGWSNDGEIWCIRTADAECRVRLGESILTVTNLSNDTEIQVELS